MASDGAESTDVVLQPCCEASMQITVGFYGRRGEFITEESIFKSGGSSFFSSFANVMFLGMVDRQRVRVSWQMGIGFLE